MHRDLDLNTVTLWAMWKSTVPTTMQGFGDYCKNMMQDNGSNGNSISITLRDTRDNNTYTVAKLKDGKCWMTQNLKINGIAIDASNSDVSSTYNIPNSFGTGWSDTAPCVYIDSTYGGFYNYLAATANTTNNGLKSTYSLCPVGFRLPTHAEYVNLYEHYNYNKNDEMLQPPLNFATDGYYYNGLNYQGIEGFWWTSTLVTSGFSEPRAYPQLFGHGTTRNNAHTYYYGMHIRCINR